MFTACDTETCITCSADVIEGVDQNGECRRCANGALTILLRSMVAGVTRDPKTGRFQKEKN